MCPGAGTDHEQPAPYHLQVGILWARVWGMGVWGHCGDAVGTLWGWGWGMGDVVGDSCRDTVEAGTLWGQLWEGCFRADNIEHHNTGMG